MRNFLRFIIRAVFNLIARVKIHGLEHVPEGNFIIASNHLGLPDGLMVFYVLDRWNLITMVAEKWRDRWLFRFLGRYLNFIFIDRFNPDIRAMREILGLMKAGNILVIAPEGTRSRTGALIDGKPGVSYLAVKAGYPIVPVGLSGTEDKHLMGNLKRLRKTPMAVNIGEAFTLPPLPRENRDQALQEYTDEIMCRIASLLPEEYRGVYANHPRLREFLKDQAGLESRV
ncbi:MAG: 1-acyl-sn-glycerol-3-phosphate acyltransferase [Anaerolineales bacterium]|nr:1-acyl-sn-glycerol-3-phosphate acyltransferase [Anaerolineales bacterium]